MIRESYSPETRLRREWRAPCDAWEWPCPAMLPVQIPKAPAAASATETPLGEAGVRRTAGPFLFCPEVMRISRPLQGCRLWKAPCTSPGSISHPVPWLSLNLGVSVEREVPGFCQKAPRQWYAKPSLVACSAHSCTQGCGSVSSAWGAPFFTCSSLMAIKTEAKGEIKRAGKRRG